jgi:hypothetical protein
MSEFILGIFTGLLISAAIIVLDFLILKHTFKGK